MATGYHPADPASRLHYGYGRLPNLVNAVELEDRLRNGRELHGHDGEPLRVAFIQCVGSRDRQHPYCSQVCCSYTLRLARLLKHKHPDAEITSFYMDLRNVGRDACQFEAAARQEIQMVRALPGDLRKTPDGRLRLRYLYLRGRQRTGAGLPPRQLQVPGGHQALPLAGGHTQTMLAEARVEPQRLIYRSIAANSPQDFVAAVNHLLTLLETMQAA